MRYALPTNSAKALPVSSEIVPAIFVKNLNSFIIKPGGEALNCILLHDYILPFFTYENQANVETG